MQDKEMMALRIESTMKRVLERLAEQERRSLSQQVTLILEEHLRGRGLWPVEAAPKQKQKRTK